MFNSKFGVGVLKHPGYNVGGGIGEAALLGAAFGGAKSLATGEDPLEGALLGGITGGAMSGVTGALFGGAGSTVAPAAVSSTEEATKLAAEEAARNATASSLNSGAVDTSLFNNISGSYLPPPETLAVNPAVAATQNLAQVPTTFQESMVGGSGLNNLVNTQGAGINALPEAQVASTAPVTAQTAQDAAINRAATQQANTDFLTRPGVDLRQYTTPDTMMGKGLDWWEKQGIGGRAMYSGLGGLAYGAMNPNPVELPKFEEKKSPLAGYNRAAFTPYVAQAPNPYPSAHYADGGIAALADGGMGNNMGFPGAHLDSTQYAIPTQLPASAQVMNADYDAPTNTYTGEPIQGMANGGIAGYSLGGYAAGGNPRLLKGPGDGMSDNIPATIGGKQPARLADGEFVVPADVVSHLGNGSTDAGAKHLYNMMDKVRKARTGKMAQGKQINPNKFMPV